MVKNNNIMAAFFKIVVFLCKSDIKKYKKADGDSAFFT